MSADFSFHGFLIEVSTLMLKQTLQRAATVTVNVAFILLKSLKYAKYPFLNSFASHLSVKLKKSKYFFKKNKKLFSFIKEIYDTDAQRDFFFPARALNSFSFFHQ